MHYLTNDEIIEHLEKEELIKKDAKQARLLAITKPEVVKVVREEAEKIGIDLERITSVKEGEKFKKAHDAELKVLNKERNEKLRKSLALGKHEFENYMGDLNSLSRRYERINKIPKELGIQSALPAHILKQASSKSLGRKRKHMELQPKVKVPGLDYDRSLPEGVPFVNNMAIEKPEYGIFFTNVFGDQAFQE
ncbi:hypothetical protein Tco_1465830 [Tanacetum coccineum]